MKDFLQPSRQRFLLVALAWGLGCGIAISCLLFGVYFYSQLPRSWNTRALRVHKVSAGATSRFNDQLEEVSTGLTFTVALENMDQHRHHASSNCQNYGGGIWNWNANELAAYAKCGVFHSGRSYRCH